MTEAMDQTLPAVLNVLEKISEQLTGISNQQAELLAILTESAESSLVDELAALLQPLSDDLQEIKTALANSSPQ